MLPYCWLLAVVRGPRGVRDVPYNVRSPDALVHLDVAAQAGDLGVLYHVRSPDALVYLEIWRVSVFFGLISMQRHCCIAV